MSELAFGPGDILFFTKLAGDVLDEAIVAVTQSRFVHVAIAINGIQKIEALQRGIVLTPIDNRAVAACWHYMQQAHQPVDTWNVHNALTWLIGQKGNMYGNIDLVNAALMKLEHGVTLATDQFDCSALATEFLLKAGGVQALQNVTDVHRVTPGDLADLLGVK